MDTHPFPSAVLFHVPNRTRCRDALWRRFNNYVNPNRNLPARHYVTWKNTI
jgi:hypothetical protein